jgi:hypothetical protein
VYGACHCLGTQSLASQNGHPCSLPLPDQVRFVVYWQWDTFFSQFFSSVQLVSFHQCSTLSHPSAATTSEADSVIKNCGARGHARTHAYTHTTRARTRTHTQARAHTHTTHASARVHTYTYTHTHTHTHTHTDTP